MTFSSILTDYNIVQSGNVNSLTDGTIKNNLHIKDIIVNESKDQYLLIKLKSNVIGNIAVVATKYPSSRNKYPIPNSDILI